MIEFISEYQYYIFAFWSAALMGLAIAMQVEENKKDVIALAFEFSLIVYEKDSNLLPRR